MQISASMVKELREKTGAGIMDAKRALEEVDGNMDKAAQIIAQQGLARAEKKTDRVAAQGLVEPYIHGGGRIGAMVEVNCETDFVARTPDFQSLAHDIAMQVAALNPKYISESEIPEDELNIRAEEVGSKDEAVKQLALLSQEFIKDSGKNIEEVIKDNIAKLGENIVVRRFSRFELGETAPSADESED